MTEQINKQCPFCGEYIPIADDTCKYCGESLVLNENKKTEINRNSNESADKFNDNISNHKKPILKYILIVLLTFLIGAVVVFAILFIINKNIDVSIIPHETDKIKIPDIIENKPSENIHKAKNLYKEGKKDEAAQLFQEEINSNNNPTAYYYMGEIYKDENFTKIAISNYKNALIYKKNFYEALKRLAEMYQQKGDYNIALDYADKAIKQKPNDLELLKTIAQIHNNLGNIDKVLQTYKKIVQLDAKDYDSNLYLAYHYYDKEEYKQAIPYLTNLLNISYNTQIAYTLAISYSNIEYYTKAIETLDKIIENDPYEYYSATYAKSRLTDMKAYYNATHNKTKSIPNSNKQQTKTKTAPKQENYNEEAENALF